jgi:hypothetical protein
MRENVPDRLHWWQTHWFVLAAALLATVPLLWPTIPPLVDLPGHMGRYRVQLDHDTYAWLGGWYGFRWSLIGNLGVDLLVQALGPILGLEVAVKLIVLTIPALTVIGLLWIAREVHGRIPATALFALPLAYNYPFQFGFVNFALSMALALNAFALWLYLARHGRLRWRAAWFVPLSCLIWVCHAFGWGVLGILIFSAELMRARDAGHRWLAALGRAGLNCVPLALPFVMMMVWRNSQGVSGETGDWFNWHAKVLWLVTILRDRWQVFDIAATAMLFLMLFRGLRDPNIEYSRNLGLSVLLLLATFVLLPRIVFGSAYADMRLAPFVIALALVALRPRAGLAIPARQRIAAAALTLFLVRLAGSTYSYYLFDQRYDRELRALEHVPIGARLVTFVGTNCRNDWMMSRLDHLPSIALVRRRAYANDQWAMAGAQLLTTRYDQAGDFVADPSQLTTDVRCTFAPWRPIGESLATFPRASFDYVWLVGPPPYDRSVTAGLVPIWRDGTSILFRIDHRPNAVSATPSAGR